MLWLMLACTGENTNDSSDSDPQAEPSAPTTPTVTISPSDPLTGDDLTCTAEATDADGDELTYAITWLRNNQPADVDGDTVSADQTSATETWICEVVATDATGLASDKGSDQVGIGNTPPGVPEIAIEPAAPTTADDITCFVTVDAEDADGHPVEYQYTWLDTNGEVDNGFVENEMPADKTSPGQLLACQVNAFDGLAYGDAAVVEFTVQ